MGRVGFVSACTCAAAVGWQVGQQVGEADQVAIPVPVHLAPHARRQVLADGTPTPRLTGLPPPPTAQGGRQHGEDGGQIQELLEHGVVLERSKEVHHAGVVGVLPAPLLRRHVAPDARADLVVGRPQLGQHGWGDGVADGLFRKGAH